MTEAVFADWNLGPGEIEALALRVDGQFVPGHHVDNAIVRGAEKVTVKNLGPWGSDHDALLYTLTLPNDEEFRVIAWNVYVGQRPDKVGIALAKMVDQHQPHAIALSEAYRCYGALGQLAGYRRIQGHVPLGENRDCALMVRLDLTVVRSGIERMARRWVGPKHGLDKEPRRFPRARVRTKSGQTVRLMAAHLPFGPAPVQESLDRIARWFNPHHH